MNSRGFSWYESTQLSLPAHRIVFVAISESNYTRYGERCEYRHVVTAERVARIGEQAALRKVIGFRRYIRRYDRECTRRIEALVRADNQREHALNAFDDEVAHEG